MTRFAYSQSWENMHETPMTPVSLGTRAAICSAVSPTVMRLVPAMSFASFGASP